MACHPTKKVNKAEELTYLSTNIDVCDTMLSIDILGDVFSNYIEGCHYAQCRYAECCGALNGA